MKNNYELSIVSWFKRKCAKPVIIEKGDIGVHQDILTFYTYNDTSDAIKHSVFTKVRVVEVYNNLVEVEILDMAITDSASDCVIDLVKTNTPRYMNPKDIKWQLK